MITVAVHFIKGCKVLTGLCLVFLCGLCVLCGSGS
jgi:hypothetical protein